MADIDNFHIKKTDPESIEQHLSLVGRGREVSTHVRTLKKETDDEGLSQSWSDVNRINHVGRIKLDLRFVSVTNIIFSSEIQSWFLAFADILISIIEKAAFWPNTAYDILEIPESLSSHIMWVFGKNGFTLMSIFQALLDHSPDMEFVLLEGKVKTDMVPLNKVCGLIGQGLKQLSQSILNNPGGIMTIVPPEVTKDNIQFLLEVTARLNNFFELKKTNIAVLTHFWPPTYHNPWLKHLSLDFNCGDPRKYTRLTKAQQESRILQGRCKRGKTLIPSQMGYLSTKKTAVALFQ